MNRWLGFGLILVALGAFALRAPDLDRRPMHNDEAVNAIKLQGLWEKNAYLYDPNEFHGPVLSYAALVSVRLSRAADFAHVTEATLRIVPVLFGAALILLLWLMADGLGRAAALFAGVFLAISPAMVFYSRYFIHEMLLVFFTALLLAAGWRYTRTRNLGWSALGGTAVGLMYATKETFLLPLAAIAGAAALTMLWIAWWDRRTAAEAETAQVSLLRRTWREIPPGWWNWEHLVVATGAAIVVSGLFFSSFFANPIGPVDALRTYLPWLHRAAGASPHIHPWWFYGERLLCFHQGRGPVWSEALILVLAAVGFVAALRGRGLRGGHVPWLRFLAFYTVLLTAAYSAISYKTPWCLLGFLHGLILLAGVGAVVVLRWHTWRWLQAAVSAALVFGAGHLGWEAWQTSFVEPADPRNPYVYAQTSPDILELVEKVQAIAKVDPQGNQMLIKVMMPDGDYWPLPWYLREFKQVGWWDRLPPDPAAPVMIAGAKFQAALEDQVEPGHLMTGIFSLRPQTFLELYVEAGLWKKYVEEKQKPK